MSFVIAILLALILVAMISSNKAAAAGVWTVVRFALWGAFALICWGLFIGYWVWLEDAYPRDTSEWMRIAGFVLLAILPPAYLWILRKGIAAAYKKDKWATFKRGLTFAAWGVLWMIGGVLVREVQTTVPNGGWLLILVPVALLTLVLIVRTLLNPMGWREVWLGPPPVSEPWEVVAAERDAFEQAESAAIPDWSDWTHEERSSWEDERTIRERTNEKRLAELQTRLEEEKDSRIKKGAWSVRGFLLLFLLLAAFGLVGILWELSFDYALGLEFVRGRAWLAGAAVIAAFFLFVGICVSAWETFAQKR